MSRSETKKDLIRDSRLDSFGRFVEANRRIMRAVELSLRDAHGFALIEFEALLRLARSDERRLSMSELAEQMVLTSGGATRLVDRLVEASLVERVACPDDRRVQWVKVLDAGLDKLEVALVTHLDDIQQLYFTEMSATERSTVDAVLDRLRHC